MIFILSFGLSVLCTFLVKKLAVKLKVFDYPDKDRKLHKNPIPLLGGLGIFLSFWLGIFLYSGFIKFTHFKINQLWLIFFAGLILMIVGYIDDTVRLKYQWRLLASVVAVLLVLAGGLNFDGITNPFGGTIGLDFWKIHTQYFGTILVGVDILAFLWLMGMMYTVKILDGLDGLSTGVVAIGALSIAGLAGGATKFHQPDVAMIAIILAATCLGFLVLNFYPAKIFLGEGGGQFLGLMIGVLAIVAGSKIATALLVMAVPIVDLVWVIISRLFNGQSVAKGDRRHLHFRLVDIGLKQWQAVLIFYGFSALFGLSALYMSSIFKIISLLLLVIAIIVIEIYVSNRQKYVREQKV